MSFSRWQLCPPGAKKLTINDKVSLKEFDKMRDSLATMMSSNESPRQNLAYLRVSLEYAARQTTTSIIPTLLARLRENGVFLSSLEIFLGYGIPAMDSPLKDFLDYLSLDSGLGVW